MRTAQVIPGAKGKVCALKWPTRLSQRLLRGRNNGRDNDLDWVTSIVMTLVRVMRANLRDIRPAISLVGQHGGEKGRWGSKGRNEATEEGGKESRVWVKGRKEGREPPESEGRRKAKGT